MLVQTSVVEWEPRAVFVFAWDSDGNESRKGAPARESEPFCFLELESELSWIRWLIDSFLNLSSPCCAGCWVLGAGRWVAQVMVERSRPSQEAEEAWGWALGDLRSLLGGGDTSPVFKEVGSQGQAW